MIRIVKTGVKSPENFKDKKLIYDATWQGHIIEDHKCALFDCDAYVLEDGRIDRICVTLVHMEV